VTNDAIVDDERETLSAHAHPPGAGIGLQAQGGYVLGVAVGEHHDLVADAAVLAPGVHDEYVIHGRKGNSVDTLGQDRVRVLYESGKVFRRAGRRKRSRYGYQYDFLPCKQIARGNRVGTRLGHDAE
jgi:hypothetical protein